MTYLLPVIATRWFSPQLRTSDNSNRMTNRWRTIVTKTSNGIREGKIPPRSNKHRDMVVKTRRRQRVCVSLRGDLGNDSWSLSHLGYSYPGTTPVMIKLDHNRSCPWVWIAQVTKTPTMSDSWNLSHLGYLYLGTTTYTCTYLCICLQIYVHVYILHPCNHALHPWISRNVYSSQKNIDSEK